MSVFDEQSKIKISKSKIPNWFSGDFVGRVTPVPIPNTEVKPAGADGTARVTAWESRKSPGFLNEARSVLSRAGFFVLFCGKFPCPESKQLRVN